MEKKNIAIACQGGGTHAAFTWGVLTRILEIKQEWDSQADGGDTFDITSISGTSAGALCALATWYGLVPNRVDRDCGTSGKAIERLNFLWTTFGASTPIERSQNATVRTLMMLKEQGAPFPDANPYLGYGDVGQATLSLLGARQQYLSFPELLDSLCPHFQDIDWPKVAEANCRILAGAIEVISGNFEVFDSDRNLEEMKLRSLSDEKDEVLRWQMRRPISLEGVAASGTLPEVLRAERIENSEFPTCTSGGIEKRDGYYWDGLYSQNPPVKQFLDGNSKEEKPHEIWVIRINPQEMRRPDKLPGLEDIRDRENELAGNISLHQELDHILRINKGIGQSKASHPFFQSKRVVEVRTIKMTRETAWKLRATSKLDRDPEHFEELRREGRKVADAWLEKWRSCGDAFDSYPNDARYREGED